MNVPVAERHLSPAGSLDLELEPPASMDLRRALLRLYGRRWLLLAVMLGVLVAGLGAMLVLPHRYTATAQVMLDPRQTRVTDGQEVLSSLPPGSGVVDGEVQVLKSRELAEAVVGALHLDAGLPLTHRDTLRRLGARERHDRAVDQVIRRLKVARVGLTPVIEITFTAGAPGDAARIANAFADRYVQAQLDAKLDATRSATDWLNGRLTGLRAEAESSEAAARGFEAANGLVGVQSGQGATLAQQEISNLETQLAAGQAAQSEAEAELATARDQLDAGSSGEDVGAALLSPVVQDLRRQRADASAMVADLSGRYGPRHPDMLKAQRRLADLDAQIQGEVGRVVSNLRAQAAAARRRTASLEASLAQAHASLIASNTAAGRLADLQSRAQADQGVYQSFLDRYKQTSALQGVGQADARVISRARAPQGPDFPRPKRDLPLLAGVSLAVGLGAAILAEMLQEGVTTGEAVERTLGVTHLASVPDLATTRDVRRARGRAAPPAAYLVEHPHSSFAESFRELCASIAARCRDDPAQVIAVASALPGEGKTLATIGLARTLALAGARVVMVDADLRQRSLASRLGMAPMFGLLDVLSGGLSLDQALIADKLSGAWVLPLAPGGRFVSGEVFATPAMDRLLTELRSRFNVVLCDTAPLLVGADTRIMVQKADMTVMAVRWRATPRRAVEAGLHRLQSAGAKVAGVALMQVDAREQARIGYGDPSYYARTYGRVYG